MASGADGEMGARVNDYRIPTFGQFLQGQARAEKGRRAAKTQGRKRTDPSEAVRRVEGEDFRVSELDTEARVKWHREQAAWHRNMAALLAAGQTWMGGFLPTKK